MFDAAIEGRVRALYVMGEDIAQTDPDSAHVRAAVAACDLVVVQEIFLEQDRTCWPMWCCRPLRSWRRTALL